MAITMLKGDSYPIYVNLKQNGIVLNPAMIEDLEVCVGEDLRYTYSGGTVFYDGSKQMWYFWPTQEQTLASEGALEVYVRVKYPNLPVQVLGAKIGNILIKNTNFTEVL